MNVQYGQHKPITDVNFAINPLNRARTLWKPINRNQ